MADSTLNFGKHAGKRLSEIPLSYVEWLSEQESIRKQPEVVEVAKKFLAEQAAQGKKPERKYQAPRTKQEAEKYSWMITHILDNDYLVRQARLANLENRDEEGFLVVFDGDDKHEYYEILYVRDDGTCDYAGFESEEQLRRVLKKHSMEKEYDSYSHRIYEVDEAEDFDYYEDIEDQMNYW